MGKPAAKLTFETAEFNRALQMFSARSKKSSKVILEEQGKLVVVAAAHITPPNKSWTKWNKKGGDAAVRSDLARLFKPSAAKSAQANLASYHRENRDKNGRVRKDAVRVKAKGVAAYRKSMLARVGKMAAGWKKAASDLNAKLPAWIKRHNSAGYSKYTQTGSGGILEMTNAAVYSSSRTIIEKKLPYVLKARAKKMMKRVNYYLAKNAKRSGFGYSK